MYGYVASSPQVRDTWIKQATLELELNLAN